MTSRLGRKISQINTKSVHRLAMVRLVAHEFANCFHDLNEHAPSLKVAFLEQNVGLLRGDRRSIGAVISYQGICDAPHINAGDHLPPPDVLAYARTKWERGNMARRSTPWQKEAERHFPVRVSVFTPSDGFGGELDKMRHWLNANAGRDRYWMGSHSGPDLRDAAFFYFVDLNLAKAFVDHFGCEPITQGEWLIRPT
jgi:hypothetical protein